jgi:hypothetical protein
LPKTLATLVGGYKVEPTWLIGHRNHKFAPEEKMFDSLTMMIEYTFSTSMPILFRKVIFGKDYSSTKIPRKKIV